ncbi:hypothetical protein [Paenibacillus sp.]
MANKYRSEDDDQLETVVEVSEQGGEPVVATTSEPENPPTTEIQDPVNPVESSNDVPEEGPVARFRSEGEDVPVAPEAPAEEAPAAPVAPEAPEAPAAPAEIPAADPAAAPVVADVPQAAPMAPVEPQPEAEVAAPLADGVVPPAAEVAPQVEAPTAPVEAPIDNAPVADEPPANEDAALKQYFRLEDEGEPIAVTDTEPSLPETTEVEETGDDSEIVKDVNEPINPVVSDQEDGLAEDVGTEAPAPAEVGTHDEENIVGPDAANTETEEEAEAEAEVEMIFRMEDGEEVSSDNGDQDVDVHVEVRKDDGDEHDSEENGAEMRFGFRQEECPDKEICETEEAEKEIDDIVPVPDPNAGNPVTEADMFFDSCMFQDGSWL